MTRVKPDARLYGGASVERLRELHARTGLSQAAAAVRLGVGLRTYERWMAAGDMPYPAQFALEALAAPDPADDHVMDAAAYRAPRKQPVARFVAKPPPAPAPQPPDPPPAPAPRKPHPLLARLKR